VTRTYFKYLKYISKDIFFLNKKRKTKHNTFLLKIKTKKNSFSKRKERTALNPSFSRYPLQIDVLSQTLSSPNRLLQTLVRVPTRHISKSFEWKIEFISTVTEFETPIDSNPFNFYTQLPPISLISQLNTPISLILQLNPPILSVALIRL
jgi:hypothetical protein